MCRCDLEGMWLKVLVSSCYVMDEQKREEDGTT